MVRLPELSNLREVARTWVQECGGAGSVEEAEELAVALQREVGRVLVEEAMTPLGREASYEAAVSPANAVAGRSSRVTGRGASARCAEW